MEINKEMDTDRLLGQMTTDEKIRLLSGKNNWQTQDDKEYGISSIFMADGPCGLRKQTGKGDHLGIEDSVPATAMVSGGCLAATWNPKSAFENGKLLGEEAAAEGVDLLLAPAMNLVRSPLCGRNFEYFSEDPYLTGQMAASYVEGIQSTGTGACPKHFAVNNQETEREYIDAIIDERTLRELYLPGFEETIKRTKPAAVMSALNQINGSYGAEQKHLLTDILRKEWGFDGITISDWYGVVHRDKAVDAGLDLEMPSNCGVGAEQIKKALECGELSMEAVDLACLHLLNTVKRIAAQKQKTNSTKNIAEIHRMNHRRSQKIAEEGIVLLKNEDSILPLRETDQIAVIGSYAAEPKITLDGSARVIFTEMDIPLECMREIAQEQVFWAKGFAENIKPEQAKYLAEEALSLAGKCEKVIFFMGQGTGVEMEGHDRIDLKLPENQVELLEQILRVNKNVVVVLSNASAVEMPWKERVKGMFECFLAGQGFGSAIAKLLYGRVNPSGRLPVSFTKCLEDTSAYLDFPGDGKKVFYSEGVFCGYRYYDKKKIEVLFPFGFGLSYTTFEYLECSVEAETFSSDKRHIKVSVSVKNTGTMVGAEVVQLYIGMFDSHVKRPTRELKRFQKIYLEPKEIVQVDFYLEKRDFAYYDTVHQQWYVPEGTYEIQIGASSRDIRLSKALYVKPEKRHLPLLTGWSEIGEFRKTSLGEKYYIEIKKVLRECLVEDSVFLRRNDLDNEEKMNQMPLRFLNILTNGILDNDQLLNWIDKINKER